MGKKQPKPLKKRQSNARKKKSFTSREKQESNLSDSGRETVNTLATKAKIHCFGNRGRGKNLLFCGGAGNPLGPGTYTSTKPMSATTLGGTRNPRTFTEPGWVWLHWEEGAGKRESPYLQGTGPQDLPNTENRSWNIGFPLFSSWTSHQVTNITYC